MLETLIWLVLGVLCAYPLHMWIQRMSLQKINLVAGGFLSIAAFNYVLFALWFHSANFVVIGIIGVAIYASFYLLATIFSPVWLALGWMFHPAWDGAMLFLDKSHEVAPEWYGIGCISFDLLIAYSLFLKIYKNS